MPVPMHPVTSTNLSTVGWQDGTLYITFRSGKKYKYLNVPEFMGRDILQASSPGNYFNKNVKGYFTEEKI